MAEDPGWVAALGGFWRTLFSPSVAMRTKRGKATPVLVTMRTMMISSIVSWLILLNVILYVHPRGGSNLTLVVVIVAAYAAINLVLIGRLQARPHRGSDAVRIASECRARFILSWALANGALLAAFAGVFIAGKVWVFAIGMPFGALGLVIISPSRARIEHDQNRLRAVHSKIDLLDALMLPNSEVPQRIKKR